jgi:hypothetical protein
VADICARVGKGKVGTEQVNLSGSPPHFQCRHAEIRNAAPSKIPGRIKAALFSGEPLDGPNFLDPGLVELPCRRMIPRGWCFFVPLLLAARIKENAIACGTGQQFARAQLADFAPLDGARCRLAVEGRIDP